MRTVRFICMVLIMHTVISRAFFQPLCNAYNGDSVARYNIASFWLAQGTGPLLDATCKKQHAHCASDHKEVCHDACEQLAAASKNRRNRLLACIKAVHRTIDLIMPVWLQNEELNKAVTACRSLNIVAEEGTLCALKQYLGVHTMQTADRRLCVRTSALARIPHKAFFKMIDTAINKQGAFAHACGSGVRAGVAEAAYVGTTQLARNLPVADNVQDWIKKVLPGDAYPHTFVQHMSKLVLVSILSTLVATYIV